MSTIKTTNITHGSNSGTNNLVLTDTGNVTVGADLIATKQNGCQRIVLEQFLCPCDGSVIALQDGNHTMANITGSQVTTTTWTDISGSSITYTPPTGTTQVIYEFNLPWAYADPDYPIMGLKFFIDSDEVVYGRRNLSSTNAEELHIFKWAINIGGSASTNSGRLASWSSSKTLKMQCQEYSGSYEAKLFQTNHHGSDSSDTLQVPLIGITAIG